jgi:hippurate hydrolase
MAESVGQLHGARVEVELLKGTPPLVNTPEMTALSRKAARIAVGDEQVTRMETANMGAEDFAYYLDHVPGCYVRFGSRVPGKRAHPAHSSRWDFDEHALAVGAAYYHAMARVAGQAL